MDVKAYLWKLFDSFLGMHCTHEMQLLSIMTHGQYWTSYSNFIKLWPALIFYISKVSCAHFLPRFFIALRRIPGSLRTSAAHVTCQRLKSMGTSTIDGKVQPVLCLHPQVTSPSSNDHSSSLCALNARLPTTSAASLPRVPLQRTISDESVVGGASASQPALPRLGTRVATEASLQQDWNRLVLAASQHLSTTPEAQPATTPRRPPPPSRQHQAWVLCCDALISTNASPRLHRLECFGLNPQRHVGVAWS